MPNTTKAEKEIRGADINKTNNARSEAAAADLFLVYFERIAVLHVELIQRNVSAVLSILLKH